MQQQMERVKHKLDPVDIGIATIEGDFELAGHGMSTRMLEEAYHRFTATSRAAWVDQLFQFRSMSSAPAQPAWATSQTPVDQGHKSDAKDGFGQEEVSVQSMYRDDDIEISYRLKITHSTGATATEVRSYARGHIMPWLLTFVEQLRQGIEQPGILSSLMSASTEAQHRGKQLVGTFGLSPVSAEQRQHLVGSGASH